MSDKKYAPVIVSLVQRPTLEAFTKVADFRLRCDWCGEEFDTGIFNCIEHSDNCTAAKVTEGVDIGIMVDLMAAKEK